jgi:hypothetical protein
VDRATLSGRVGLLQAARQRMRACHRLAEEVEAGVRSVGRATGWGEIDAERERERKRERERERERERC